MTTKRKNWTEQEQREVIRVYFHMLACQAAGAKYNKAAFCRATLPKLNNRTRGSYEMKLMNVSAAMVALGLPIVKGYKPYGHAQKSLTVYIKEALIQSDLERAAA